MKIIILKSVIIFIISIFLSICIAFPQPINILDYGAKPDGKTLNTQIIQQSIDACYSRGGGTVVIPGGIFMTGSLTLKDHVNLHLENNATLLASTDIADFPGDQTSKSLILIDQVEGVTLSGEGTVDGRGDAFNVAEAAPDRPFLVLVRDSKNVRIEDVSLRNSAFWTLKLLGNQMVRIHKVNIYSHVNYNNDGIDIDSKDVIISDCYVDTDDDALCFKSDRLSICENITVTNCILASNCNFIKMGTSSFGGFRNISISNCVLRPASESNIRFWNKTIIGITDSITGISGIALEVVDGGFMDQVTITNISMEGVQTPIFIRLGNRRNPMGSLKNVIISNIIATTHSLIPSSITALPGFQVENIVLRDMIIQCKGGGSEKEIKREIPEMEKAYPENRMFGYSLPAYGLYIRHARNITLDNLRFALLNPDDRVAVWLEDAHDIDIRSLKTKEGKPPLREINTSGISIQ
jgi:polygalacturonase